MTVPTDPRLRQVAGLVDKVSNFGAWPPTKAYLEAFKAKGILFNLRDASLTSDEAFAIQIAGARSNGAWAGVWHPVPDAGANGAMLAAWISARITGIDIALQKIAAGKGPLEWAPWAHERTGLCWLNFEGFTIPQWRSFLWGSITAGKGWRGYGGVPGSDGGMRPGLATGFIDQGFQDGTVCPHNEIREARIMLAVEGFYGPTSDWPDMTPNDHPQALIDRIQGARSDGTTRASEAYPPEQVVGCYDAALGRVVENHLHGQPAEPLLIRSGLHFTLERARQAQII